MTAIGASILGLLVATLDVSSVGEIAKARAETWCETCPGGRFRVRVDLQLQVEQPDRATDGSFFPISDRTGRVVNLPRWSETATRAGRRYSLVTSHPAPPGLRGGAAAPFEESFFWNGTNTWKHRAGYEAAVRAAGHSPVTRIPQDYYGDLIGAELGGVDRATARTVPAPTAEPYAIDAILRSDLYHPAGTAVVAGEPCVVVERTGRDRVWLAERKGLVVVRREWRWAEGGPLKRRIENQDFREAAPGVWLPWRGRMIVYGHPTTRPGRRVGELTAVVRAVETAIADDAFEPQFPRGTRVLDSETGKVSRAGMSEAEDQAELEARARARRPRPVDPAELARFAHQPPPWWGRRPTWLVVGGAIAVIIVVAGLRSRV